MTVFSSVFDDGRRAARALWRYPTFTLCVLALLTVTVGTVTAVGAAAYELLNGRLPYGAPDRLAMIWSDLPKAGYWRAPLSGPEVEALRANSRSLGEIAAIFPFTETLSDPLAPIQITTGTVTSNFFEVLRATPLLGRTFTPNDEGPGKVPTVVLSWELWQNRYGGDPKVIGQKIRVGGADREVIGVMPASFWMAFPPDANVSAKTESWLPFSMNLKESPSQRFFVRVVARLQPDATLERAAEEVNALVPALREQFAHYNISGRTLYLVGLTKDLAEPVRVPAAALVSAAVLMVLLAYVNLAGLWVARTMAQQKDLAVHQALGASVPRLVSQQVIQAMVLSVTGSLLGLTAGIAGLSVLKWLRPPSLARIDYASLPLVVIIAVVAVVVLSTIVLAAVCRAAVAPFATADLTRTRVASTPRHRVRTTLVVVQVALALVFLVCSALWTRTYLNVMWTDPGFRPDQAITFKYSVSALGLGNGPEPLAAFHRRLTEAIEGIPGVTAAGSISHLPYDTLPNWAMVYRAQEAPKDMEREADARPVSPGFLAAIGGRLLGGRFLSEADHFNATQVVVVDRMLAERTWPGQNPIGKQLSIQTLNGIPPDLRTVIGVIEHVRYRTLEAQVREQIYLPARQYPWGPSAFIVRASGDPRSVLDAIRDRIRQVDRRTPIWDMRLLQERYDEAAAERRFTAGLLVTFAVGALVLASIGIYGLLAYLVVSRRSELGVRMALGAGRARVARDVLFEGLRWAIVGIGAGSLALALLISRLAGALYGVTPFDPWSWAVATGLLLVVVALASWGPAIRAGRADLTRLMRSE